jgi:hypothetical protein
MNCPVCNKRISFHVWCFHRYGKFELYYGIWSDGNTKWMQIYEHDATSNRNSKLIELERHIVFNSEEQVEKLLVLV